MTLLNKLLKGLSDLVDEVKEEAAAEAGANEETAEADAEDSPPAADTDEKDPYVVELEAMLAHYLPEGTDLDTELDRIVTNRHGEVMYLPAAEADSGTSDSKESAPKTQKRPAARKQSNRSSGSGKRDIDSMTLEERAQLGEEMDKADAAGRPIV